MGAFFSLILSQKQTESTDSSSRRIKKSDRNAGSSVLKTGSLLGNNHFFGIN